MQDLDERAHYEPPHQDLHRLQIHLFSSLVLNVLNELLHSSETLFCSEFEKKSLHPRTILKNRMI